MCFINCSILCYKQYIVNNLCYDKSNGFKPISTSSLLTLRIDIEFVPKPRWTPIIAQYSLIHIT